MKFLKLNRNPHESKRADFRRGVTSACPPLPRPRSRQIAGRVAAIRQVTIETENRAAAPPDQHRAQERGLERVQEMQVLLVRPPRPATATRSRRVRVHFAGVSTVRASLRRRRRKRRKCASFLLAFGEGNCRAKRPPIYKISEGLYIDDGREEGQSSTRECERDLHSPCLF